MLAAFIDFYRFSPARLSLCFLLMLLQGLFSGAGLLLLLPLLQLSGISTPGIDATAYVGSFTKLAGLADLQLSVGMVLVFYVAIITGIATLGYALSVQSALLQQGYIRQKRNHLYQLLLNANWEFICSRRLSDFLHALGSQVQAVGVAASSILTLCTHAVLSLIFSVIAISMSWRLSLLALLLGALLLCLLIPLNRRATGSGQRQMEGYQRVFRVLNEQLHSLKFIKSHAGEALHADKLAKASELLEAQHVSIVRINALTKLVYMAGAAVSFSLFFWVALRHYDTPVSTLLVLLFVMSRLLPRIQGIQVAYQKVLHQLPAFKGVQQMIEGCIESSETASKSGHGILRLNNEIRAERVRFSYPDNEREVINNLSFSLGVRQTLLICGPSGSGKTTLADIIAGLISPTSGQISVDGHELNADSRQQWRKGLSYVTQEVFLFNDSVRENLRLFAPQADDNALWKALDLAAASDFARALPKGLDTVIGERGIRLSGGERQRLAIARALLQNPSVLILDEATNSLDSDSEASIHQALSQIHGKFTVIVISHRPLPRTLIDRTINLAPEVFEPA